MSNVELSGIGGLLSGLAGSLQRRQDRATQEKERADAQKQQTLLNQLHATTLGFRPTDLQQEAQGTAQQNAANLAPLVGNPGASVIPATSPLAKLQGGINIGGTPWTRSATPDAIAQHQATSDSALRNSLMGIQLRSALRPPSPIQHYTGEDAQGNPTEMQITPGGPPTPIGKAYRPDKPESTQLIQGTKPDGTPSGEWFRVPKSGPAGALGINTMPKPAGAGGGQFTQRSQEILPQLDAAIADMNKFENAVRVGKEKFGPSDVSLGNAARANPQTFTGGLLGPLAQKAQGQGALGGLIKPNVGAKNYMNRAAQLGQLMKSAIPSGRSDLTAKVDAMVSSIDGGWTPETIAQVQNIRNTLRKGIADAIAQQGGTSAPATPSVTPARRKTDAVPQGWTPQMEAAYQASIAPKPNE